MPTLELIGFFPQVAPLVILLLLSFVLNVKLFLPTVGQIFAVRKQSSYAISNLLNQPESTAGSSRSLSTSLSTSIFSSPGSLGSSEFGSSLHSVLQTQFSTKVNTDLLKDLEASEESKKLQTLISYKVK